MMKYRMLLGGFGGQGVQTLGNLLSFAGSLSGKSVTFVSDYGGLMRGGVSGWWVLFGDEVNPAPNMETADCTQKQEVVIRIETPPIGFSE